MATDITVKRDAPIREYSFGELERMSVAIAKSGLFGAKTPEQALSLMMIAQAEGKHPALIARDFDIIQGRPAKKAEAMMRDFHTAGGKVEWHVLSDTKAEATFSHAQGGSVRIDWTMERADKAGLAKKDGGMYQKYPRAMLRSRCVSEGIRAVWPSGTSGLYTPEELVDEAPRPTQTEITSSASVVDTTMPEGRVLDFEVAISEAATLPELQAIFNSAYKAAHEAKDTGALARFTKIKDARKLALTPLA